MILKIINKLTRILYILLPMVCILLWAFIAVAKDGFTLTKATDYPTYYYVTKLIFTKPEEIYKFEVQPYTYTPIFVFFFWPLSLFTFEQSAWIYYFVLIILAELTLIVFNQILIIKKVSNRVHRFLFLIAISNGLVYMNTFDNLTGSMLPSFILILFIKREIEYRDLQKDRRNKKFIFFQMMLLMLAIGIFPQFFFFVIIYIFYEVNELRDIFNKYQFQRYILMILAFLIQNFMFIIIFLRDPLVMNNFLGGYWRGLRAPVSKEAYEYSYILEVRGLVQFPVDGISSVYYSILYYYDLSSFDINLFFISLGLMSFIAFILILMRDLKIEIKFGLWSLSSLFFYTLIFSRYFVGLLPLIVIIFAGYYSDTGKNIFQFVIENFLLIVGLLCIAILYLMPPIHLILIVFPFFLNLPVTLLILRYLYVYIVILVDLILLNKKFKHLKIEAPPNNSKN